MQCPKCGYVSFPGIAQCKKCGCRFAHSSEEEQRAAQVTPSVEPDDLLIGSVAGAGREVEREPQARASGPHEMNAADRGEASGVSSDPAWLAELSARVAGRRRRRSNPQEDANALSLEFSFGEPEEPGPAAGGRAAGRGIDLAFDEAGARAARAGAPPPPAKAAPGRSVTPSAPARLEGAAAFRLQSDPARHVDVLLGSSIEPPSFGASEPACAPVGPRFWAGIADAVVLIAAGAIFTAIFLIAGGKIRATPANLPVAIFMVCFWIFIYFAVFSAIAFSTPGQAAMGLKLRNLDGGLPTLQEALLRAFGYLVSIASLMLGFLWSVMDSDGMAWHDHISGTMLMEEEAR